MFYFMIPWQNCSGISHNSHICSPAASCCKRCVWPGVSAEERQGFFSPSHSLGILSWSVCWEILSKSQCLLTLCQQHVFMDFHCWQSPHFCWPRTSRITLCKYTRVHSLKHTRSSANVLISQTLHRSPSTPPTGVISLMTRDWLIRSHLCSVHLHAKSLFLWSSSLAMLLSK